MNFPTTVYKNVAGKLHSMLVYSEDQFKKLEGKWGNNPMDVGIETHPASKNVTEESLTNAHVMSDAELAAHEARVKAAADAADAIAKADAEAARVRGEAQAKADAVAAEAKARADAQAAQTPAATGALSAAQQQARAQQVIASRSAV